MCTREDPVFSITAQGGGQASSLAFTTFEPFEPMKLPTIAIPA
jgi:hypothetical protein